MRKKFGCVIITHGKFGIELLEVARHILGDKLPEFAAIELPFMRDIKEEIDPDSSTPYKDRRRWLEKRLLEAKARVDQGQGILVFTDLMGGTSFNVAEEALQNSKAALISGVNLPMLLKASNLESTTLEGAAEELGVRSRQAIHWHILP
mgnify:CR=1 FL=1